MKNKTYFEYMAYELEFEIFEKNQIKNQNDRKEIIQKFLSDSTYQNRILKTCHLSPLPSSETSGVIATLLVRSLKE